MHLPEHYKGTDLERIASWVKGTGFRSDFCSRRGSPVPSPLRNTPYCWVPVGMLDEEPAMEIAVQLCADAAAPWNVAAVPGVQFEAGPEVSERMALLHPEGQR